MCIGPNLRQIPLLQPVDKAQAGAALTQLHPLVSYALLRIYTILYNSPWPQPASAGACVLSAAGPACRLANFCDAHW